jgi:hypothetical protein
VKWCKFESAEDLAHEVGTCEEVLIFDGCDYHIDYVETESEFGTYFMANETKPEFYCVMTYPMGQS